MLTASQRRVLDVPYEPSSTVKVVAGPGSGKTTALLHKVHHLIESQAVYPDEILILSLTNKAVDNIVEKLLGVFHELSPNVPIELLEREVDQIGCYTIHGLGNRVVTENEGSISIIEENGWRGLSQLLSRDFWIKKHIVGNKTKKLEALLSEYKKNNKQDDNHFEELLKIMNACKVLTNEDLILKAADHLRKPSQHVSENQEYTFTKSLLQRYKVVLIDEFQDLFPQLVPLLEVIAKNKQLFIFGDVHQSIYEFLGDNRKVVERLDNVHENLTTIHLDDNFRCTPEIMASARRLINKNKEETNLETISDLIVKKPCGITPIFTAFDSQNDHLRYLVSEISQAICSSAKFSDIAILTMTNSEISTIAEYLKNVHIPFEKLTAQPEWMSDFRILFIIDLMKAVFLTCENKLVDGSGREGVSSERKNNWKSDFSVITTLNGTKGIGTTTIQQLYKGSSENGVSVWEYLVNNDFSGIKITESIQGILRRYVSVIKNLHKDEFIKECLDPLQILEKITDVVTELQYQPLMSLQGREAQVTVEYLSDLLAAMRNSLESKPNDVPLIEWFLNTYVEQAATAHHQRLLNPSPGPGKVKLSTIHSAKGLEFPIVFVSKLNQMDFQTPAKNHNVLYVAMTRARNLLYLTNISHDKLPKISLPSVPLIENREFWMYYNKDLKRYNLMEPNILRYNEICAHYNLNPIAKRLYSTACRLLR
ncbi:ATP-dependent DNA helicase HMI1, mitochondrial [Nakaseomyces bracarensis]|uniref:DNA 3'-5' helicase n=1 Tax=Nakaseomyces bracarensis TaxID=273131 RepID=A0ABR4NP69_9SACH